MRRARSCPSSSSGLGPIWSSTLHPDVPRSSVLTRPPQKEKGRDTQRPGAGSRGGEPGLSPGRAVLPGAPSRLPGRRACADPAGGARTPDSKTRRGRRGSQETTTLRELHREGEAEAPRSCLRKVSGHRCAQGPRLRSRAQNKRGAAPHGTSRQTVPWARADGGPRSLCEALWLFSEVTCSVPTGAATETEENGGSLKGSPRCREARSRARPPLLRLTPSAYGPEFQTQRARIPSRKRSSLEHCFP